MEIQFQTLRGKHELSPFVFHIFPCLTFMWHPKGKNILYVGWFIWQIKFLWKPNAFFASVREYFKRLKTHAGLETATFMTLLSALAGASNKSFENVWHGALFGLVFGGVIFWGIVLISNFKSK